MAGAHLRNPIPKVKLINQNTNLSDVDFGGDPATIMRTGKEWLKEA
jgi:hypothetical protein